MSMPNTAVSVCTVHSRRIDAKSSSTESLLSYVPTKRGTCSAEARIAASGSALVVSSRHRVTLFALGAAEEKDNNSQEP